MGPKTSRMEKWEWQITVCTPSVPMDPQRSGVKFLQSLVSGAGTLAYDS